MPLFVFPAQNSLKKGSAPYCVRSKCSKVVSQEEFVERLARFRTTLGKPEIAACFELFREELAKLLADGFSVKTCVGTFYLSASGRLESPEEAFVLRSEGGEHQLRVHYRSERSFERAAVSTARIERRELVPPLVPELLSARGLRDKRASTARAGEWIKVVGKRLKFEEADPQVGLFFQKGSARRSSVYAEITPSVVVAEIPPALPAGSYDLALRTKTASGELREGLLPGGFEIE